jgi:hypothetical protein
MSLNSKTLLSRTLKTYLVGMALYFVCSGTSQAQIAGEVGLFAQVLKLNQTLTGGAGGRLSLTIRPGVQIDFEGARDFKSQAFNAQFQTPTGALASERMTTAGYEFLVGPQFQLGRHVPVFVSIKAGAFRFHSYLPDISTGVPNNTLPGTPLNGFIPIGTSAALYPSAGIEFGRDRSGLRVDIGDEILFSSNNRNNLKIEVGPIFRF